MSTPPIRMAWDGEALHPFGQYWAKVADRELVVGERYNITVVEERSQASHNHYFAALHEAWLNLPEEAAERFPTDEHLRKYALIKVGYRDERSVACASNAEALRVAAFVKPLDDHAVVVVSEAVVTIYTAKSQAARHMGKDTFQESKQKVLDYVAGLIGSDAETLSSAAKGASSGKPAGRAAA